MKLFLGLAMLRFSSAIGQQDPVVVSAGNICPDKYVKLTSKKGCKSAMKKMNWSDFQDTEKDPDWPSGCYHCDGVAQCSDGTWFNKASVGSANGGAASICALPGWEQRQANPVVFADPGNACPTGYVKLATKDGCKSAMKKVNRSDFQGTETNPAWPGGCYHCDGVAQCSDGTWFNKASGGSANERATPICAVPGWEDDKNGVVDTLFVGDSDIEYWNTKGFVNSKNVGVGGSVCREASAKLDQQLLKYKPKRVVIVCGENNLWGQSVGDTFAEFKVAIEKIVDFGAQALYLGTKPEPDTQSLHSEYQQYDARIRAYVNELKPKDPSALPPLVMVDVYPAFVEMGNPRNLYQQDKLHLSSSGYGYWNTWAQTALTDASNCSLWKNDVCISSASTKFLRQA